MNQPHLINRRRFLDLTKTTGITLMASAIAGVSWSHHSAPAFAEPLSPEDALKRLLDGNQRFVQQQGKHPDQTQARLQEVAQAQHPFAALLSCADSRVPPEILFDTGIGDLFDIRVAGNVVTPEVLGSLEYAVEMLGTRLIMVLGHERCGAVTAAVQGERLPGHISSFVKAIKPSLPTRKAEFKELVDAAVVANVQYQIQQLKRNSTILGQQLLNRKLKVVGGRYDLDTGEVVLV